MDVSAGKRKPTKRRTTGTGRHQGRVTVPGGRDRSEGHDRATPNVSNRYTPRRPSIRLRPGSHKVLGWGLVLVGVVLALVNDYAWFGSAVLPGGHSELYLLLAVAIAGYGTWWLGIFDRPS